MVEHGAAVSLADGDLGEQLKPTVLRLLNDPQALAQMGERARALSKPQAAHDMAKELARLASEREEMAR
jgi:UDP-N-acetylglucosamine:LPS N-acetylglucosamine transferase